MMVTVAVCTWNRSRLLDRTLAELAKLRVPPGVAWELLVVNNRCTDDTAAVVERYARSLPLRQLFEPTPGLSQARNRAVAAAAGELILWTDDDVLVDPDWLATYVAAAEQWPDAAFFGGPIDPWFAVEPPRWIARHLPALRGVFAILQAGEGVRPLAEGEFPYGANMAFRTPLLKECSFDGRLGRVGDTLTGMEEIALMRRLVSRRQYGVWVGPAKVRHYIPAERLTRRYVRERFRGDGRTEARVDGPTDCAHLWGAPRWALRAYGRALLKSWLLAPRRDARWLNEFRTAARLRGVIDETRAERARTRPQGQLRSVGNGE